jgi:hypothetical protein
MIVQSRDGQGTLVIVEMPVLQPEESPSTAIYAARSNTRS